MTDRELLELAAKAAGWKSWDWLAAPRLNVYDAEGRHDVFDPLTDDGDALRLAVKLEIHVQPSGGYVWASTFAVNATEEAGPDPYAATRRAVVRAAAEIGRGHASTD